MLFGRSRNNKNQAPASASTPTFVLEESKESLDRSIVNLSKKEKKTDPVDLEIFIFLAL